MFIFSHLLLLIKNDDWKKTLMEGEGEVASTTKQDRSISLLCKQGV
jgi:hypothetical protein